MTAKILVVDDIIANTKLLEAKLVAEYYDVATANSGFEALEKAIETKPDLILLDVMMPGMDGFECCRKLKSDAETAHIPVVMVTALTDTEDRINGLKSGADDFLAKPIDDMALMVRVKSLVRTKMLLDELRLRDLTGAQIGVMDAAEDLLQQEPEHIRILLVDDDPVQIKRFRNELEPACRIKVSQTLEDAQQATDGPGYDVVLVSTALESVDGLRLATQLKSNERFRYIPIIILVDEFEKELIMKGLEIGINDYLIVPADPSESRARINTQVKRKRYQEALKLNYKESLSMASTDNLTGLYNRHYLDKHLDNAVHESLTSYRPLSLIMLDMDHFKEVNDNYGHDCGDDVLRQLADLIRDTVRGADLAARFGGEEFVILMPSTKPAEAGKVARRLRELIESTSFQISNTDTPTLKKTASLGVSSLNPMGDDGQKLLKRADEALYEAKNNGRNRVIIAPDS